MSCSFYAAFAPYYSRFRADSLDRGRKYIDIIIDSEGWGREEISVLDLGCGTGDLVMHMCSRGWTARGVDSSAEMISIATGGLSNDIFVKGDICEPPIGGSYDLVVCFGDTVNHLVEAGDWLRLFKTVNRLLEGKGVFCFDVVTPYDHCEIWPNNVEIAEEPGCTLIARGERRDPDVFVQIYTWFHRSGSLWRRSREELCHVSFPLSAISEWLADAGFFVQYILDGDTLDEPSQTATRWFVCAKAAGCAHE